MNRWPPMFTSCWSAQLPEGFCRIGISRGTPRGQKGFKRYMRLAPGPWMRSVTEAEFISRYNNQLAALDACEVADELVHRSAGKPLVLLCYERPREHKLCHRALVALWLSEGLGQHVTEFGYKACPLGSHPLLPSNRDLT